MLVADYGSSEGLRFVNGKAIDPDRKGNGKERWSP